MAVITFYSSRFSRLKGSNSHVQVTMACYQDLCSIVLCTEHLNCWDPIPTNPALWHHIAETEFLCPWMLVTGRTIDFSCTLLPTCTEQSTMHFNCYLLKFVCLFGPEYTWFSANKTSCHLMYFFMYRYTFINVGAFCIDASSVA